jgi:hypothetical protein
MNNADSSLPPIFNIIYLVFLVFFIIATWKVFAKAGKPGWAAIIPLYNTYVMLKIAGKPGWWLLLFFVPIINFIVSILLALGLAQAFGKSGTFGIIGLWLFSPIGYAILAFGDAQYVGSEESSLTENFKVPQQPPQQVAPQQIPPQQNPPQAQ